MNINFSYNNKNYSFLLEEASSDCQNASVSIGQKRYVIEGEWKDLKWLADEIPQLCQNNSPFTLNDLKSKLISLGINNLYSNENTKLQNTALSVFSPDLPAAFKPFKTALKN